MKKLFGESDKYTNCRERGGKTKKNSSLRSLRFVYFLPHPIHYRMFIQRDAGHFAVVFREVNERNNDIVVRHAMRRQAGDQVIQIAKRAFGGRGPLPPTDTNALCDANALAGLQRPQDFLQLRADPACGRWNIDCRRFHVIALCRNSLPISDLQPELGAALRGWTILL